MNDVLHANVFFFISSIAAIIILLLVGVLLCYVIRIVRDVSDIVRKIKNASADIEHDFQDLRRGIKDEGTKVRTMVDLALGFILSRMTPKTPATPRRKPKQAPPPEEAGETEAPLQ